MAKLLVFCDDRKLVLSYFFAIVTSNKDERYRQLLLIIDLIVKGMALIFYCYEPGGKCSLPGHLCQCYAYLSSNIFNLSHI